MGIGRVRRGEYDHNMIWEILKDLKNKKGKVIDMLKLNISTQKKINYANTNKRWIKSVNSKYKDGLYFLDKTLERRKGDYKLS